MEQMNEVLQGKVSKVAVANALKKRVSHEELDLAVQRIYLIICCHSYSLYPSLFLILVLTLFSLILVLILIV